MSETPAQILDTLYATLESALAAAGSGDTVILTADYTVQQDVTVAEGVTLVIPYDSSYSTGTEDCVAAKPDASGSAYVTLTVPEGITLTVNGTLLVNGVAAGNSGRQEGVRSGDYGCVALDGTLEVNGTLYARGLIEGAGCVKANDGSAVYQMFQIKDWRGGTVSSTIIVGLSAARRVFPFNSYEVSNIRTDAEYAYGSTLLGQGYVYINNTSTASIGTVNLISTSSGLFIPSAGTTICSGYDAANAQLDIIIDGDTQIGSMSITASTTLNTANFVAPVSADIGVTVASGTLTVSNNIKLLPGSFLTVNEGAALTVASGKSLYVYDADAYLEGFTYGAPAATEDAVLTLNGAASGNVYSSDSAMGNITGSAYTASASGSTATIREYVQSSSSYGSATFYKAALTEVE